MKTTLYKSVEFMKTALFKNLLLKKKIYEKLCFYEKIRSCKIFG